MMRYIHFGKAARVTATSLLLYAALCATLRAQTPQTGAQQLTFSGLRAAAGQGQINAVQVAPQGSLYLLIDQKDGVRILKTDAAASTILAQAQIGASGDIGLSLTLDPAGNVYVTGTTTSGALTATSGAAFTTPSGTAINSFVARFDANLNTVFVSFTGGSGMAATAIVATADAVFLTGSIFSATLPVTPAAILQAPAFASTANGFVEKFSTSGSTLLYATYLSGASGSTTPSAIAADASDNAYIAGTTTAPGYPTIAAVIPAFPGTTSGFLTRLTPAGDGIVFSTFLPGGGITSIALDPLAGNLLLTGSISLGQFPVATAQTPLIPATYQVLVRMPLDGSAVLNASALAPGTQSFVAVGSSGTAWVDGSLSLPLLPVSPLATFGDSFAAHISASGTVDQAARFGGLPTTSPGNASALVNLTSVATDPNGQPLVAGSFAPSASASLLATETFDLPLLSSPTVAFPATVRSAVLPSSSCAGSLCSGSAAYLAKLTVPAGAAAAALALSVDDAPILTIRNLGSATATALQVTTAGFTYLTNCGSSLAAGAECSVALAGTGPGSITVQAANAVSQTQSIPATTASSPPVVFSPRELDFGIVSSVSGPVIRTITVSNLTQQSQIFASVLDSTAKTTLPYTLAEQTSDCTPSGTAGTHLLAPGGTCHITLGLSASNIAANDGLLQQSWRIGTRDVLLTGFLQAAALSVSSSGIDFGTQYTNGLRLPRYLYLSNSSTSALSHAAVVLPAASAFTVIDRCPSTLEPLSICQMQLTYQNAHTPAVDATTLSLDQGLTVLVTGRSLPQPSANGATVNPNLAVSDTSLAFATPVVVTGVSGDTQTLTLQNTGASAFALSLSLAGDFADTTSCSSTLAAHSSCSVVFTFAPSAPGTRQGVFAITAGAGTTPDYVTLSGTGNPILSPANNGTLDLGAVPAGQPSIQWIKVTQPFTAFAASTASSTLGTPFTVALVEDIGYGHGQPPATAYTASTSGTCFNCWLGVRFVPATTGPETATLTLVSAIGGNPYVLSLSGTGLPLNGLLLTPAAQDFGPIPIHSVSNSALFTLTNLLPTQTAVTLANPSVSGDFSLSTNPSGGTACGGTLAYTASCFVEIAFSPTAPGPRSGTLTLQAGSISATADIGGYGVADPGLALSPTALVFANVPPAASTLQTLTLTNTGSAALQVGTPTTTGSSFLATTTCATLLPGAACAINVAFAPSTAQVSAVLQVPITGATGTTVYSVALTGAYTTEDAGLEIIPGEVAYGPQAVATAGIARQFAVNNLTSKSLALNIALPRQYVLTGPPCAGLAPFATCIFSVAFLPLDNGDLTGTLFAQATPTDGSATLNGIGYLEGYGIGSGTLAVTGGLLPGNVLNFNQVPSGQSAQRTLTLTNTSPTLPLTIRRITSGWPFLSTNTCGATLGPAQSCTVTLTYTPLNQVAPGTASPPSLTDVDTLVIESDASSSPDLIDLTGSASPAIFTSPSNIAPLAAFTPSQSSLTFAATQAGNVSAPQVVTLANTGTATLHLLGLQTSADFTVTGNCGTLVPGASCPLSVTFTPQNSAPSGSGAGTRVSAIEISSDASTSLEFISLVGASSPSTLQLSPASLAFPTTLVGASATLPVQVTNTGNSVLFQTLSASGDFAVSNGTCPAAGVALVSGSTCTLQITFAPTQAGARTGSLSLASSATSLPLTVPLTGTGAQSHLQISPASLPFGSVAIGQTSSLSLTLANTGSAPITGVSVAIPGDYAVTTPCVLTTLTAGGSCSLTVTFAPTSPGTRNSTLTIVSSDATSPASIPVTGIGVLNGNFTLTANGAATASATVSVGAPATYALTVTPANAFTGTVVLNCSPLAVAQYAYCSLLPSSLSIAGSPQSSTATLTTVTSVAAATNTPQTLRRYFADTVLALVFPGLLFTWKARNSPVRAWRTVAPILWGLTVGIALLTSTGCGGGTASPSTLRYAAPGTYQYQVTASSVGVTPQVIQTVTLNLTVQ